MRVVIVLFAVLSVQACSKDVAPLKSPCVGAEKSPCGPRTPINDHWMS
jgi:hypothetical protein